MSESKTSPEGVAVGARKRITNWMVDALTDWNKAQLIASLLIILLASLSPIFIKSPYYMGIIILTVLYAYIGISWNIVGGYAGELLIAHIVFMGMGAYTTLILLNKFGISPWFGILVGALSAVVLGVLISLLTQRYGLKEDYYALFTIALALGMSTLFTKVSIAGSAMGMWVEFKGVSFSRMTFVDKTPYLYISLGLLTLGVLINYFVARSKFGSYIVAAREDNTAAASLGVNTSRYKSAATLLTAAMEGLGGGVYAIYTTFIKPQLIFGLDLNVEFLIAPIIGGRGTIIGPILGAILNKPIVEVVRGQFSSGRAGTSLIIYGSLLMLFILFLPRGVAGLLVRPYEKFCRQIRSSGDSFPSVEKEKHNDSP